MRRFCFLAFGLAVMTLSKIADRKDEVKLSRNTVMSFYGFTKWAVKSDMVMKIFFSLSSKSLAK